jgi:hypothetical protein
MRGIFKALKIGVCFLQMTVFEAENNDADDVFWQAINKLM